jgi:hypothetical protein
MAVPYACDTRVYQYLERTMIKTIRMARIPNPMPNVMPGEALVDLPSRS